MGGGLQSNDPTVVSAFHAALLHQGLVALALLLVVVLAWNVLRSAQLRRAATGGAPHRFLGGDGPEPAARRVLRISFGLIWVFDGVLQGQSSMPLGLVPSVVQPAASPSPSWVRHLVDFGANSWAYHPVSAAAAAVWIQVGVGAWLLVAARGNWSRLAGVASCAWGLVIWVFGEAFGGVFAPGLTWLSGAPGAVAFYSVAGALVALPDRAWVGPRLGRVVLRSMGAFFVGMAVLQAWPGRGFWQGQARPSATAGTLVGMVRQVAGTPQPHLLASWVGAFAGFDAAHGWGVNLVVVVALTGIGAALLTARPTVARVALLAAAVLCLADWILIEDLGFMGGTGTDPNSMVPMLVVLVSGYLGVVRPPATDGTAVVSIATATPPPSWRARLVADPTYALRSIAALCALGVVLIGVVPMAAAATDPNADPVLSEAVDGTPVTTDAPAPAFTLVDQDGRTVSLGSLRGKTVGLTFLDPVCTSDCPIIAQEFRDADTMLGPLARQVVMVAVDANPRYRQAEFLRAFDAQERLGTLGNWRYLTGSLSRLEAVWAAYGVEVSAESGGAMVAHSDIAYVIDPSGRTRFILDADPGPATAATQSSFAVTLANAIRQSTSP